jgi:hypothetical protein
MESVLALANLRDDADKFATDLKMHLENYDGYSIIDNGEGGIVELLIAPHTFKSVIVQSKKDGEELGSGNAGDFLKYAAKGNTVAENDDQGLIIGLSSTAVILVICCCCSVWCTVMRIPTKIARRASGKGEEVSASAEKFAATCPGKVAWFIEHLPDLLLQLRNRIMKRLTRWLRCIWGWFQPFFTKSYDGTVLNLGAYKFKEERAEGEEES